VFFPGHQKDRDGRTVPGGEEEQEETPGSEEEKGCWTSEKRFLAHLPPVMEALENQGWERGVSQDTFI
jgi:hypothetical protein